MKNFIFGYARVSTEQKSLDRQADRLLTGNPSVRL